jgi:hypothetical protein
MPDRTDKQGFTNRAVPAEVDDRAQERRRLAEDIAWLVLRWLRRRQPKEPPQTDETPPAEK